jgi:hypothetical protein
VGLVAYQYELRLPGKAGPEVRIDARLRLARLAGLPVATFADVDKLARTETLSLGGRDDASARDVLRRATKRRYTWDEEFPGFRGRFEFREGDQPPVSGGFAVDGSFRVTVEAPTEATRAAVRSQVSSFVTFRRFRAFDAEYAGVRFRKGPRAAEGEVEVLAEGDGMASSYLVRDGEIRRVSRSVGRLRYEVVNRSHVRTEDGRTIAIAYDLGYYSNRDQSLVSAEQIVDSYARVGAYWLPTGRTVSRRDNGQERPVLEVRFTELGVAARGAKP